MRTVGQSLWDDIKILGQRLGHLISNSEPGGTAPPLAFPPSAAACWCPDCFKPRSAYSEDNLKLRGSFTSKKYVTVSKQWSFIQYVAKTCVHLMGQGWDIDIKIWGKILGHWYKKNHGVPLSPYCVYSVRLWLRNQCHLLVNRFIHNSMVFHPICRVTYPRPQPISTARSTWRLMSSTRSDNR